MEPATGGLQNLKVMCALYIATASEESEHVVHFSAGDADQEASILVNSVQ